MARVKARRARRRVIRTPVAPFVVLALWLPVAVPLPASAATTCASPPAVFPVEDLAPGMTATGLTTVSGTTPTSFTVEILGVMPDYIWLDVDAIVVRIIGPQSFLDQVGGVFHGMSGSPVSIDGKLVGAVSYAVSWDPTVFGLTPAQTMLDMLDGSRTAARLPDEIPFDAETARAVAAALEATPSDITSGLERLPTYLGVSGLSGAALEKFDRLVGRRYPELKIRPASGMKAGLAVNPAPFSPGQPVGSALSWGDFSLWTAGTVTLTCGDELLAYGHSIFDVPPGRISLGMTGVNVLAVGNGAGLWPGDMVPALTEPRGAFVRDTFTGDAGIVGKSPPSMPITTRFSSPDTGISRSGRTDAIMREDWWDEYSLWGHLVLNLGAVEGAIAPGTVRYTYTIRGMREDGSTFRVSNRLMKYSDVAPFAVWKLVNTFDWLIWDRWEDVTVTGVHVEGSITRDRLEGTIARIRTSSSLQPRLAKRSVIRARPGARIRVEATLHSLDGGPTVATTELRVPRSARGDVVVSLRGGKRDVHLHRASSLDELLRMLKGGEHRNDLIVAGLGRTVSQQEPVIVRGNGSFVVRVVR
jgi:hypothetical protein